MGVDIDVFFFSLMKPLFDSFGENVMGSNVDEMARSAIGWVEGHCGQAQLRQSAMATLKDLSLRFNTMYLRPGGLYIKEYNNWIGPIVQPLWNVAMHELYQIL